MRWGWGAVAVQVLVPWGTEGNSYSISYTQSDMGSYWGVLSRGVA